MRTYCFYIAFTLTLLSTSAYSASLSSLLGVDDSIDRGVAGLQAVVDRAHAAADDIESKFDKSATAHINQLDALVDKAVFDIGTLERRSISDANTKIELYLTQLNALESQIVHDLSSLIDQFGCETDRALNQKLNDTLGGFGRVVMHSNSIEISAPVMYPGECQIGLTLSCDPPSKTFRIQTPFSATYSEILKYIINDRLYKLSRDDTPLASIIDSYRLMGNFALRAGCLDRDISAYTLIYLSFSEKIRAWKIASGNPAAGIE